MELLTGLILVFVASILAVQGWALRELFKMAQRLEKHIYLHHGEKV